MEALYTISHSKYLGATSVSGYPATPTFQTAVSRACFGWYPLSSQMPETAEFTRRVLTSKVVMVPDISIYSPRDKIVFPGGDVDTDFYFVSEDVRDYTNGPFGFKPGGEIVVEKVSG
jgi:hypothetical protein